MTSGSPSSRRRAWTASTRSHTLRRVAARAERRHGDDLPLAHDHQRAGVAERHAGQGGAARVRVAVRAGRHGDDDEQPRAAHVSP